MLDHALILDTHLIASLGLDQLVDNHPTLETARQLQDPAVPPHSTDNSGPYSITHPSHGAKINKKFQCAVYSEIEVTVIILHCGNKAIFWRLKILRNLKMC